MEEDLFLRPPFTDLIKPINLTIIQQSPLDLHKTTMVLKYKLVIVGDGGVGKHPISNSPPFV